MPPPQHIRRRMRRGNELFWRGDDLKKRVEFGFEYGEGCSISTLFANSWTKTAPQKPASPPIKVAMIPDPYIASA